MKKANLLVQRTVKTPTFWIGFLSLLLFLVLAYFFPYSHDDWFWGTSDSDWNSVLRTNGRYLGSLFSLILTRSVFLKTVVVGGCCWSVCYLLYKIAGGQHYRLYLSVIFGFLVMPKTILAQAVVWTSGFSNYVPPVLLILLYFYLIKNVVGNQIPQYAKWSCAVSFTLGLAGGLFMENITIFNVLLGVFVLIFVKTKFQKVYSVHVAFLVGAILSAALMFSNPIYLEIFTGNDPVNYRTVEISGIASIVKRVVDNAAVIIRYLFLGNPFLFTAFTVLLSIFARKNLQEHIGKKIWIVSGLAVNWVSVLIIWVGCFLSYGQMSQIPSIILVALALFSLLFIISSIYLVFCCILDTRVKYMVLFPIACAIVCAAPLLIVSPIGPRNFFGMHIFLAMSFAFMITYLLKKQIVPLQMKKALFSILGVCVGVACVFYLVLFGSLHINDVKRIAFARAQSENGAQVIYLAELVDYGYVHCLNPVNDEYFKKYKEFYNLNEDSKMELVSSDEIGKWIPKT